MAAGGGIVTDDYRNEMKRSVVFIVTHNKSLGEASGSLVDVNEYMPKPLLLTCNHIILTKEIAKNCSVWFDRLSNKNPGTEVKGADLFDLDLMFMTNENLDFTLIAIKPDKIPGAPRETFSFTKHKEIQDSLRVATNVTLIHYPYNKARGLYQNRAENSSKIVYISDTKLLHEVETFGGSGGCPVLHESNGEWVIVGLHSGTIKNPKTGKWTKMATIIKAIEEDVLGIYSHQEKPDYDTALREATANAQKLEAAAGQKNGPDRVGGDLSAQLGEEYKAVVEQNACITLQISKCTTIGPPRVGKTCLKYLLIARKWDRDEGTASTDAMEAPEWVEVFHGDEDSTWTRLDRETRKDNLINDMALQNYDLEKTGGDVKKTGGDLEKTGGDVEKTGRDLEKTGGDVKKTGGDLEKTGGDVEKTGGDFEKTGGDFEKTGGDVKKTGKDVKKTVNDVEKTTRTHSKEIKELQSTYEGEVFQQKLEKQKENQKK